MRILVAGTWSHKRGDGTKVFVTLTPTLSIGAMVPNITNTFQSFVLGIRRHFVQVALIVGSKGEVVWRLL